MQSSDSPLPWTESLYVEAMGLMVLHYTLLALSFHHGSLLFDFETLHDENLTDLLFLCLIRFLVYVVFAVVLMACIITVIC